jgi:hypothetical protein
MRSTSLVMHTGWFNEVRVKDRDSHVVRALLTSRGVAGEDQVRSQEPDGLLAGN